MPRPERMIDPVYAQAEPRTRKTRYAFCGLSQRAISNYIMQLMPDDTDPQMGAFADHGEVVAVLDMDEQRVEEFRQAAGLTGLPGYREEDFDRMVDECAPDVVVVAGPDATHCAYAMAALARDLDVLIEKPMVVSCAQAQRVIEAERASAGRVFVTFNYRYTQLNQKIKRMIQDGMIGRPTNVEMVWNVDTVHGSSYFQRWNRYRSWSGGLSVHKCCHHFDLVNWFVDSAPEAVFAFGALNYYGPDSPHKPQSGDGGALSVEEQRRRCPYRRQRETPGQTASPPDEHLDTSHRIRRLGYYEQYQADSPMYIYDADIDVEDTYSVVVRYRNGASLSYSTNFSAPWEGYQLGINGTHGRIACWHLSAPQRAPWPAEHHDQVICYPLFGERQVHDVKRMSGGHGGADPLLRHDLFVGAREESRALNLMAGSDAGAYAVAIGEGVWRSVTTGEPFRVAQHLSL